MTLVIRAADDLQGAVNAIADKQKFWSVRFVFPVGERAHFQCFGVRPSGRTLTAQAHNKHRYRSSDPIHEVS
jgi:hypothetical protein